MSYPNKDSINFNTANGMYTYPQYYDTAETETTVTETFYDEDGRVVKEVVTVTKTKPKSYYPYQPYVVSGGYTTYTTNAVNTKE